MVGHSLTAAAMAAVAIAGLSLEPAHSQPQAPDSVLERSSQRAFPIQLAVSPTSQHTLTGTGIRTRTFLKVKVYAYGLYVDRTVARRRLESWSGQPASDLEDDDAFYEALLVGDIPMSLRLVMTRDVDGETFAEAFDNALAPRIEVAANAGYAPATDALAAFRSQFNVEELVKETVLVFSRDPEGNLTTSIDGTPVGTVSSRALAWALFDVYLGNDPISKDGKKRVVERFPALLASAG